MKTAVVTGGLGFLGSHLCERLLERRYHVICVDNLLTGSQRNAARLKNHGDRFRIINHDVSKSLEIDNPVDYVMHLASPASPVDFSKLPIQILKVGGLGTHNMLGLAKAKGARFLLTSTSEVYGDPLVHPQPESYWGNVNPIGPRSVYDEGKRYAEALTMAYHNHHNVDVSIARIFNTYGPHMRPNDGRVVSNFVTQALTGEPLTVYGDGKQTRSFCYVDDLIDGLLALLDSGHTGPVNIGNDQEWKMSDLAHLVLDKTNSNSKIGSLPLPKDDPACRRPDLTLANQKLGWYPKTSLEEGLEKTVAYFRSLLVPTYPGPKDLQPTRSFAVAKQTQPQEPSAIANKR